MEWGDTEKAPQGQKLPVNEQGHQCQADPYHGVGQSSCFAGVWVTSLQLCSGFCVFHMVIWFKYLWALRQQKFGKLTSRSSGLTRKPKTFLSCLTGILQWNLGFLGNAVSRINVQ